MAIVLGVALRVVGTVRLNPRDLDVYEFATVGCERDCDRPPIAAGDRHPLPTGTDWTMRHERENIPIPETKTLSAAEIPDIPGHEG